MVYKPTYNWGAPSCSTLLFCGFMEVCFMVCTPPLKFPQPTDQPISPSTCNGLQGKSIGILLQEPIAGVCPEFQAMHPEWWDRFSIASPIKDISKMIYINKIHWNSDPLLSKLFKGYYNICNLCQKSVRSLGLCGNNAKVSCVFCLQVGWTLVMDVMAASNPLGGYMSLFQSLQKHQFCASRRTVAA